MIHNSLIVKFNSVVNKRNLRKLAVFSIGLQLLTISYIIIVSAFEKFNGVNFGIRILGIIGLVNWIIIGIIAFAKTNQFDRSIAHTGFLRLLYILLLVISIPCTLYFASEVFQLSTFKGFDAFNKDVLNPFLNHGDNFTFSKSMVSLLGIFLLSGVLVSMLVSFINQRAERWEKGEISYKFSISTYCIIIGGHDAVPCLAKQLVEKYDKVIIITNRDISSFRREVESKLTIESEKQKIIFYHGYRNSRSDLEKLHLERENLREIYILGESRLHGEEEASHDSLNMTCFDIVKDLRGENKERIDCYVFFEHQTTSIVFQKYTKDQIFNSLNFIPYNFYELHAQKAIGWNYLGNPIKLNRFGDDMVNVDKHVHLAIIGMSRIGMALGLEAIRVCHYPNYAKSQMLYEYGSINQAEELEELMKKRRTKITFIDCNMNVALESFRCRYKRLLKEVSWNYIDCITPKEPEPHPIDNDGRKIVPDIEIDFINGRVQSEEVSNYLQNISDDPTAVLTVASCFPKSNQSIATILCLPKDVLKKAEIMVYQSDSIELVNSIRISKKENNIKAFGEISQAVNLYHLKLLESMAQRINNVYVKKEYLIAQRCSSSSEKIEISEFSKEAMRKFEEEKAEICKNAWQMEETRRWANRYHASAVWQKVSYVQNFKIIEQYVTKGITEHDDCMHKPYEGLMARTEHNRWCIEQWLLDRDVNQKAFYNYKAMGEDKETESKYCRFPTNDQVMTMAIPYILGDECENLMLSVK